MISPPGGRRSRLGSLDIPRRGPADVRRWLASGGVNTDGLAPEVARLALRNPELVEDLISALDDDRRQVRGHAADALERVSRARSDLLEEHLARLASQARNDPVPMVRWHLVMILGVLALRPRYLDRSVPPLMASLADSSAVVRAWAISSLCLIGREFPRMQARVLGCLSPLRRDVSRAVRVRARKAVEILADHRVPIPASWVKAARSGS